MNHQIFSKKPASLFLIQIVFCFFFFMSYCLWSSSAHAGGQIERIQEQRAQMMQQAQQQAIQQAVQQRQQQLQQEYVRRQQQAYAQAVAQRQAEMAVRQRQMQMAVAQRQAQQLAYNQAVAQRRVAEVAAYKQAVAQKQAIEQRRAQIQKSQVQAYAQAVAQRRAQMAQAKAVAVQAAQVKNAMQQQMVKQVVQANTVKNALKKKRALEMYRAHEEFEEAQKALEYNRSDVRDYVGSLEEDMLKEEVTTVEDLWEQLDHRSTVWSMIADREIKTLTVAHYLDRLQKDGVQIRKSPGHYAKMIDDMSRNDRSMLEMPFEDLLRVMAVMEYDFDNGQDPDRIARQVLGDFYETNKKRLGR